MKNNDDIFIQVMLENKGEYHRTIEGQWFANDYYDTGMYSTRVHNTIAGAAREYCQIKDLIAEVLAKVGARNEPR